MTKTFFLALDHQPSVPDGPVDYQECLHMGGSLVQGVALAWNDRCILLYLLQTHYRVNVATPSAIGATVLAGLVVRGWWFLVPLVFTFGTFIQSDLRKRQQYIIMVHKDKNSFQAFIIARLIEQVS